MDACEVVRHFVNKAIVPTELKRRGNPGYRRIKALRVLIYSRLIGLDNDTRTVEHLKKHKVASRTYVYVEFQIEQLLADGGDAT